jgi:excisionase family DNA binding protein
MSEINFTERELAEIETLTLTKKIARSAKGALTAKQLAELLNISPKTIFKMAKAGRLPSFRIGTAVRFDARLIVDWLRRQRTGHPT